MEEELEDYKHVYFDKDKNKWIVQMRLERAYMHRIGEYENQIEAHQAYSDFIDKICSPNYTCKNK